MSLVEDAPDLPKDLRVSPAQKRSGERVKSILAAAQVHYDRVGQDRFNFDGVAELAGCSVGTLYRYFNDRVALLDVIAPDRNVAAEKLAEIRNLRTVQTTAAGKWSMVEEILDR